MREPSLLTFDIFGTVVDWRRGLMEMGHAQGARIGEREFDAIIDAQARLEAGPYRSYAEIVADSLVQVVRMPRKRALAIGARAGLWPLFPDAADGLRMLMRRVPCVAMTNSDPVHGRQVQDQLGFRLSGWICAEDVRCYKPDARFWMAVGARLGVAPGPEWWHVSAYADYDHVTAARLGMTTVFVDRPHARWGPSTHRATDLRALAARIESTSGP